MEFVKSYLLLNLKDYFDGGIDFPINLFLLSIALGICVASFILTFHKRYCALILKQLVRHNAYDPENAKTLGELHIKPSFFIRSAFNRRGQLTDMVKRVGAAEYTYEQYVKLQKKKDFKEEKIDFENARFFLSPERIDRIKRLNEEGIPSYLQTALGCILIFAIFVCISLFMPEILSFISGFLA